MRWVWVEGDRGVFLLVGPEDAEATIDFYSTRVRAELRHVRGVKALARRYRLFNNYTARKAPAGSTLIYF